MTMIHSQLHKHCCHPSQLSSCDCVVVTTYRKLDAPSRPQASGLKPQVPTEPVNIAIVQGIIRRVLVLSPLDIYYLS